MAKPKDDRKTETAKAADAETPERVDHVAAVSRRADGTPDQTPGYVVVTDSDGESDS